MLTSLRAWIAGSAVVAVLLVVASWFLVIAPERAQARDLTAQAASTGQSNEALAAKVEQLRREYVTLPAKQQELTVLRQRVPAKLALSDLTRQLDATASTAGVTIRSISAGIPSSTVTAGDASSTAHLVTSTMTLQVDGTFATLQVFLQGIQSLQRDFLVTSVTLGEGGAGGSADLGSGDSGTGGTSAAAAAPDQLSANVTGTVFVLPDASSTAPAGSAPAGSTSAGSTSAGSTPTTSPAS